MAPSRILRVPTSDRSSGEFAVLEIRSNGKEPLDLDIVGSEDIHVYKISLQQAQVSKYRSKNYKGEDSEWQAILRWALLREEHDRKHAQTLQSVELVSQPMPKTEELALHLRQSVPMEGGKPIMQQLGSLTLNRDQHLEDDVSFLDWAATAASATIEAEKQCATLKAQLDSSQRSLSRNKAQLDDLSKAKRSHEDELLEKFRQLLNTKKLKIRDQQRLLAGAQIDSGTAAQLQAARSTSTGHKKSTSPRGSKRKSKAAAQEPNDPQGRRGQMTSESSVRNEDSDGDNPMRTPETSEAETSDDENAFEAARPAVPSQPAKGSSGAQKEQPHEKMDLSQEIPPPRELPTLTKSSQKPSSPQSKRDEDEEEETDDEL